MPKKRDSSGSNSSPEKINKNINIEGRRSLRDLPGRSKLYPDLTHTPYSNETSRSPLRNQRDEEDTEFRPRLGSFGEGFIPESIRLEANFRASPSPSPVPELSRQRHFTPAPPTKPPPPQLESSFSWIIYVIFAVLIVAVSVVAVFFLKSPQNSNNAHQSPCDCSLFADLSETFPDQDQKLFKSMRIGVENAVNGNPMVMSLFSTDMDIINNVMQKVIKATQKCINQSQDPINLTSDHLNSKMIENFKEALSKRSIMIIKNVEKAQPSVVSSLHSFCDTYNPLVSKSIIFITIKVPSQPKGKPVEYITDFLNQQWKTLPDHVRNPLITRMLDQTFFLKP